uniref:Uncharacterized protein n=1 Tax=Rhizophora mucronata TaxID=61149 RepID=A0A2P2QEM3_RHIMU
MALPDAQISVPLSTLLLLPLSFDHLSSFSACGGLQNQNHYLFYPLLLHGHSFVCFLCTEGSWGR